MATGKVTTEDNKRVGVLKDSPRPRRFMRDAEDPSVYWCLSTFTLAGAEEIQALRAAGVVCDITEGGRI